MTVATQVRIDSDVKQEASELFELLGLDMSTAINIFLRQCIMKGGLPFSVEVSGFSKETISAINEAKCISRDTSIEGYSTMEDLKKALMED